MDSLYRYVIGKYGMELQLIMVLEETAELQKEIAKLLRGRDNRDKIEEEIADVEIMLEQTKIGLRLNRENIEKVKQEKLERLKERSGFNG